MDTYADIFKALSDLNRLRIVVALLKSGTELCICEIMDTLDIAQYNVSRYVKELRIADILKERREGRFVFYSVKKPETDVEKYLNKALKVMGNDMSEEDRKRLKKRLALRQDVKCVVGMRGCKS